MTREKNTIRILQLQPQPCIRTLKCVKGLKNVLGRGVYAVLGHLHHTLNELYGYGDELFDELMKLDAEHLGREIKGLVEKFDPDIIHSHNAPDFLTIAAIEAVGGSVPVVHDCHEVLSLFKTGYYASDDERKISEVYPEQEKIANERSNGRIYVSEGVRNHIQRRYSVDPERDLVFYSYVSESMMPRLFKEKLSRRDGGVHVVYIGCVTSLKASEGSSYDLREIFREIAGHNMHIHIYPTVDFITGGNDAYRKLAENSSFIHYHNHLNYRKLLQEITKYDFGWAGFNVAKHKEHTDIALPNKLFEYLACGLPVLSFPHKAQKRFIEKHGVGLVFKDIDELEERLRGEDLPSIRRNVLNCHYKFAIENKIPNLVSFYERLICGD